MFDIIIPIYLILSALLMIILIFSNYKQFKKNLELEKMNGRLINELDNQREDSLNCEKIVTANKEIIDTLYIQNKELKRLINGDTEILPDNNEQQTIFDIVKH